MCDSVVKGEMIFTLPKIFVYKKLGSLSDDVMKKVSECVKISLDLDRKKNINEKSIDFP